MLGYCRNLFLGDISDVAAWDMEPRGESGMNGISETVGEESDGYWGGVVLRGMLMLGRYCGAGITIEKGSPKGLLTIRLSDRARTDVGGCLSMCRVSTFEKMYDIVEMKGEGGRLCSNGTGFSSIGDGGSGGKRRSSL